MFIRKTGKNQDKPIWINIQNRMQNPDYYSTKVINTKNHYKAPIFMYAGKIQIHHGCFQLVVVSKI